MQCCCAAGKTSWRRDALHQEQKRTPMDASVAGTHHEWSPRQKGVTMHRPNHLVESDIRESMDYDPRLNDSRVIVKADDGRVTLSGAVDSFPERELAERDARYAEGVKAIDNQLEVGLVGDAIADVDLA